jgi:hypothetical protein
VSRESDESLFSASELLFVSTPIARSKPLLIESRLVLAYRSPFVSEDHAQMFVDALQEIPQAGDDSSTAVSDLEADNADESTTNAMSKLAPAGAFSRLSGLLVGGCLPAVSFLGVALVRAFSMQHEAVQTFGTYKPTMLSLK